jgi:hypothetical protein
MISDFRLEVYENCPLLDYYTVSTAKFRTDILGQPIFPIFMGQESKSHRVITQKSAVLNCPYCLDAYITILYFYISVLSAIYILV